MYLQNLISLSLTGCLWLAHSRELYYYRNASTGKITRMQRRALQRSGLKSCTLCDTLERRDVVSNHIDSALRMCLRVYMPAL